MKIFGKKINIIPILMLLLTAVCAVVNFVAILDPGTLNFVFTVIYIIAWIAYSIYAKNSLWLNLLPLIASVLLIISSGTVYMNLYAENPISGILMVVVSPFVIFSLVPLLGFGVFQIEQNQEMFFLIIALAAVMWFVYNIIVIKRNGNIIKKEKENDESK